MKIIIYTSLGLSKKEKSSSKKTYKRVVWNKKSVLYTVHDGERKPKEVKSVKLLQEMVAYCKRVYVYETLFLNQVLTDHKVLVHIL